MVQQLVAGGIHVWLWYPVFGSGSTGSTDVSLQKLRRKITCWYHPVPLRRCPALRVSKIKATVYCTIPTLDLQLMADVGYDPIWWRFMEIELYKIIHAQEIVKRYQTMVFSNCSTALLLKKKLWDESQHAAWVACSGDKRSVVLLKLQYRYIYIYMGCALGL